MNNNDIILLEAQYLNLLQYKERLSLINYIQFIKNFNFENKN